jgi:hypothetical protein
MNRPVTFDASLITSTQESKGKVRQWEVLPVIFVFAILAVVALISDSSLTPEQRIQVFQQSQPYP